MLPLDQLMRSGKNVYFAILIFLSRCVCKCSHIVASLIITRHPSKFSVGVVHFF